MAEQQNSDELTFVLVPQPGIKRDGTLLEGENCSDGQWVRFQRGKAKKIGGAYHVSEEALREYIDKGEPRKDSPQNKEEKS